MPYDDFQSFLRVLTQISPVLETLGWNILVANQPVSRYDSQPGVDVNYEAKHPYILVVPRGTLR